MVVQETEVAKLEADREEQKLQTTVRKPADAKAYAKRTEAEGQKAADISAAEALARRTELEAEVNARRTELEAQANATAAAATAGATRVTGEAEAAATKARGEAAASAIKAKALAEADGIKARAEALGTNQEAVISQQLAENMPAIVAAAAEPFAHVGQLTVLNGGEGINKMVGGILSQVGNYLPGPQVRPQERPGRRKAAPESSGCMMHRDVDRSLTGKIGRVTGRIGPGTIGEVMLPFRGGTSAFHAHPVRQGQRLRGGRGGPGHLLRAAANGLR